MIDKFGIVRRFERNSLLQSGFFICFGAHSRSCVCFC